MSMLQDSSAGDAVSASVEGPYDHLLDASGLVCPLPVLKAKAALAHMQVGQVLKVIVTHQDSTKEFPMLCQLPEFDLLDRDEKAGQYLFWIKKIAQRKGR